MFEIEQLKGLLKELNKNETFFEALLNFLPIPIYYTDLNGLFLFVNYAWTNLTGYSKEEMLGEGWKRLYSEEKAKLIEEEWHNAIKLREVRNVKRTYTSKSGVPIRIQGFGWPVFSENELLGYVGYVLTEELDERLGYK